MNHLSNEMLEEIRGALSLTPTSSVNGINFGRIVDSLGELLEYRKASKELVAWTGAEELRDAEKDGCGYLFKANPITPHADMRRVIKLYAAPQLQPEQKTCCHGALDNEDGVITCRSCGKEWNI